MLPGKPFARQDIVEIDERAAVESDGRGSERVPLPPCLRDLAGRDRCRVAEDAVELGQCRGVGSQVGQHLAQARDPALRRVQRAVLAPGIVEAMVPAAELARNIRERRRDMAEAPDSLRRCQSAAPANARAAGTTRCRSSGVRARRRTEAGASSSSLVLHPKNQALAVSWP